MITKAITMPRLPNPIRVDESILEAGRDMYTQAQMRAYGKACADAALEAATQASPAQQDRPPVDQRLAVGQPDTRSIGAHSGAERKRAMTTFEQHVLMILDCTERDSKLTD